MNTELPYQYNKLKIYKDRNFDFNFRLKINGDILIPDNVIFTLSDPKTGTEKIKSELSDSPTKISIDEDNIVSVNLSQDDTDGIDVPEVFMTVDLIVNDIKTLYIIGNIKVK